MTEFAIVAPVLVSLVMFATYFADAWDFKLKNQEAARFAAWEFTAFPLSDYAHPDKNTSAAPPLFTTAAAKIQTDLNTIYRDFDSSQTNAPTSSFVGIHQLEIGKLDIQNLPVPLESSRTLSSIPGFGSEVAAVLGAINGGLDLVGPKPYDFNMNGLVQVTVTSKFTNTLLPPNFLGQFRYGQINTWETSDTVALVADGWTLHDGRDAMVDASNSSPSRIDGSGPIHPMATEVDKMSFLGLKDKLIPASVQSGISTVEGLLGATFPDPLFLFAGPAGVPVASLNYRRSAAGGSYGCSDGASPAKHGEVDFSKTGRKMDSGSQNCFHTLPFYVTWSYADSPLVKIFNDSNQYYMGCKSTEVEDTASSGCH
jgi:hypothetical protein